MEYLQNIKINFGCISLSSPNAYVKLVVTLLERALFLNTKISYTYLWSRDSKFRGLLVTYFAI